jgi:glycine/D-amino acid oxidase-like deaminating enzyme
VSCALALQDAGAEVLVLERNRAASLGTTGQGEGNVLRADATGGREAWLALAERYPTAVKLREKGSLTVFEDDGARALAAQLGGDAEVVDEPWTIEPALAKDLAPAVLVATDLQVDPRATVQAMAAELPLRTGAQVHRVLPDRVQLADGEWISAAAVVVATGAWTGDLLGELGVTPRKGQLVALGPAPGLVGHKVIDARYPATVAAVIEEAITGEVYVGSSRQDISFDHAVDPDITAAMLGRAGRFMPALRDLPVRRSWAGFRPYRPGGAFVGRLASGVWACVGHEGAGVGLGPVDGRRLAQRIWCDES